MYPNHTSICRRFYDDDEQRSLANLLARHSPIGRGGLLHVPGVLNKILSSIKIQMRPRHAQHLFGKIEKRWRFDFLLTDQIYVSSTQQLAVYSQPGVSEAPEASIRRCSWKICLIFYSLQIKWGRVHKLTIRWWLMPTWREWGRSWGGEASVAKYDRGRPSKTLSYAS